MGNLPTKIKGFQSDAVPNNINKEEKRRNRIHALNRVVESIGAKPLDEFSVDECLSKDAAKYIKLLEPFGEQFKQELNHAKYLIVKIDETIDGGYLAPIECHPYQKLNYDTLILRKLLKERKLQPFYKSITPTEMNRYKNNKKELLKYIESLPLHKNSCEGNLSSNKAKHASQNIENTNSIDGHNHSSNFILYLQKLVNEWQDYQNKLYFETIKSKNLHYSDYLPNEELLNLLYTDIIKCAGCKNFFPKNINHSSCCNKPICSDCFVQVKRPTPNEKYINCPFCTEQDLTIIYKPFVNIRTSSFITELKDSILPSKFKKLVNHLEYSNKIEKVKADIIQPYNMETQSEVNYTQELSQQVLLQKESYISQNAKRGKIGNINIVETTHNTSASLSSEETIN